MTNYYQSNTDFASRHVDDIVTFEKLLTTTNPPALFSSCEFLEFDITVGTNISEISSNDKVKLTQLRLLQLHHAEICGEESGQCYRTNCCDSSKRVWEHMKTCRLSRGCEAKHCKFSKKVMTHFVGCELHDCEMCAPLRKKIVEAAIQSCM
jgi:hypothetical protein